MRRRKFIAMSTGIIGMSSIASKINSRPAIGIEVSIPSKLNKNEVTGDNIIVVLSDIKIKVLNILDIDSDITLEFQTSTNISSGFKSVDKYNIELNSGTETIHIQSLSVDIGSGPDLNYEDASTAQLRVVVKHPDIGTKYTTEKFITDGDLLYGLIAYYPMEKGAGKVLNDSTGNSTGYIRNADWINNSKIGKSSLSFDGSDSFVDIGKTLESETKWTITALVKPENPSVSDRPTEQEIVSLGDDANTPRTMVVCRDTDSDQDVKFTIFADDGKSNAVRSGTSEKYPVGNWYHVGFVRSGDNWTVYVDGSVETTTTASTGDTISSQTTNIGRALSDDAHFHGLLDEVRIYDRALSDTEMEDLSNLTEPSGSRITESDVPTNEDSGIARYKLNNNGSGDVIPDAWNTSDGTDNTSAGYVNGVYNQGKNFNKSNNDYIDTNINPDYSTSKTFSVWVKFDTIAKPHYMMSDDGGYDWGLTLNSNNEFAIFTGANEIGSNKTPTSNTWYHSVGVWDVTDGTAKLYINGSQIIKTTDFSTTSTTNNIRLGASPNNGGYAFLDGKLDDARIYDRALTKNEISNLFQLGSYRIL